MNRSSHKNRSVQTVAAGIAATRPCNDKTVTEEQPQCSHHRMRDKVNFWGPDLDEEKKFRTADWRTSPEHAEIRRVGPRSQRQQGVT